MSAATTSKVFVGSIPHTVTEEHIRNELSQHGTITQLFYMSDQTQQNRGWAFITFSSREEGVLCINAIDSKLSFPGSVRPVEARFANQKTAGSSTYTASTKQSSLWQQYYTPEGHPYFYNTLSGLTQWERPPEEASRTRGASGEASFGPPGSNLFVFHVPNDWHDIDLIQHFQHFGSILSARIQRDQGGRNKGFGFVSFDNHHASINAIRGMNGFSVGGKYLKVQLKKGEEQYIQPEIHPSLSGGMPMSANPVASHYGAVAAVPGGSMNQGHMRYAPY